MKNSPECPEKNSTSGHPTLRQHKVTDANLKQIVKTTKEKARGLYTEFCILFEAHIVALTVEKRKKTTGFPLCKFLCSSD